ncbi:hypothetical protein VTN31DRAFT_4373 [Thermomyces dupontii]|uniref:uncharacterized protein n=1 Tax=Talaromyces thermophilus TaxID=28565 RepID=UPI003741FEB4
MVDDLRYNGGRQPFRVIPETVLLIICKRLCSSTNNLQNVHVFRSPRRRNTNQSPTGRRPVLIFRHPYLTYPRHFGSPSKPFFPRIFANVAEHILLGIEYNAPTEAG